LTIYETSAFTKAYAELTKDKFKNVYGAIHDEIFSFFKINNTLDLVWMQPEFLSGNDRIRLNKTRIANSAKNLGKSYGYRIVVLCDKEADTVNLLYIFPKFGKAGIANIGDAFKRQLVVDFKTEKANSGLKISAFNKALL
jgi:hypothetical protein